MSQFYEVSEKLYKELDSPIVVERIHKYSLNVVIIYDATEDEIADLFYRLNNGTPLSPAEVRNSMPGKMKEKIKEMAKHHFFEKVSFSNRRFIYDQICAQMMMLEINHGLADTRDRTLSKMYSDYTKYVPETSNKKMRNVLDVLQNIFPERSRLLNRAATINVYLLISYLLKTTKLTKDFYNSFFEWYSQTEPERKKDNEYKLYMSSSSNSRNAIEGRFRVMILALYQQFPKLGIIQLDPKRLFDEDQKAEIFARDKGICQECSKKVGERSWHADHKKAWIKGGKTTLDNGELLCVKCNLQKKDNLWRPNK